MNFVDLGLIGHAEAEALQLKRLEEVRAGAENTVYLLEHNPVITLGRQGGMEHLLAARDLLEARGVELVQTARGGNITCHFPGQLVAYFVMRVEKRPGGIRRFFDDMEESVIRTATRFGVESRRRDGHPGVWTDTGKLCSVGIGVKRWITYHGLALNVTRDLSLFEMITPCGIAGARAVSLSTEARRDISVIEVKNVFKEELQAVTHSVLAQDQAAG